MSKPRIIIADTDISYIIPLQQKFIEEYFETIDLEIVTIQEYYNRLFSSPQRVDILIVSEELYHSDIHRHNIGIVFLMSEQSIGMKTNEPVVNRLYKYTSIKEIFSAIVGKSYKLLSVSNAAKKSTQIVLVCSACGGVGKTTIALGISACLNRNYKRVLYLNAARLHSFQIMLSNKSSVTSSDVYAKLMKASDNVYKDIKHTIRNEGFNYLPPFRAALMSLGIDYSVYEKLVLSAKQSEEYDYIIVDADTVLDEEKIKLIDLADKVVFVMRQNKASVYATNAFVSNVNGAAGDKYIFVCNDFVEEKINNLISADTINKFVVSDYVGHIPDYEHYKASDLANVNDIQKLAFLIL